MCGHSAAPHLVASPTCCDRVGVGHQLTISSMPSAFPVAKGPSVTVSERAGQIVTETTGTTEAVKVCARFRPVNAGEEEGPIQMLSDPELRKVMVRNLEFSLDRIFDKQQGQDTVYELCGRACAVVVWHVSQQRPA